MTPTHDIYLVPGFFGFANLGRLRYFRHVHDFLLEHCRAAGIEARVHVVKTHPTAGLPKRAARLAETIARTVRGHRSAVHLVGHSTGGLDARLLAAPNVTLPTDIEVERYAGRIRSVISVATPHHGSPLASFLATRRGQWVLALLSLGTAYVLRFGHLPVSALAQLATAFARPETWPLRRTLFDELSQRLLKDFSVGRRRAVQTLLREVVEDQSLLVQLMPEAMQLFNASIANRPGVRYGSVVTRGARPGIGSTIAAGLDPATQAVHALYQGLYRVAGRPSNGSEPLLTSRQRQALRRAYGTLPRPSANDGIVPTRSQVWGEIIAAANADHLDAIGHFDDPAAQPPHFDWLTSGSGFDRRQFENVWTAVAGFLWD